MLNRHGANGCSILCGDFFDFPLAFSAKVMYLIKRIADGSSPT